MNWNRVPQDIDEAVRYFVGNWKKFDNFGWLGRPDNAHECAIVYLSNRDSGIIDKSNEAQILEALKPWTGSMKLDDEDVEIQSHNHWAAGYVDGIVIRVHRNNVPTEAFVEFHKLAMKMANYPILNQNDVDIRQMKDEKDSWESYGASDYRAYLRRCAPHHDDLFDKIPNALLSSIWQTVSDANGIDACSHENDGAYFPFEDVYGERGSNASVMWTETRKTILEVLKEYRWSNEQSHPDDIV